MPDSLRATDRDDITYALYHLWIFGVSLTAVSPEDTYGFPVTHLGTSRSFMSLFLICTFLTSVPSAF